MYVGFVAVRCANSKNTAAAADGEKRNGRDRDMEEKGFASSDSSYI